MKETQILYSLELSSSDEVAKLQMEYTTLMDKLKKKNLVIFKHIVTG